MADQALSVREEAPLSTGGAFLAMIERASRDPSVDVVKLQQLMEMSERVMRNEAEMAFNSAMSRLQPRLPVIAKHGKIEFKGTVQSRFAKYEDIDSAIRPLLCEEGFSLSFDSEMSPQGIVYHGTLAHSAGHSKRASMILPADTSGSKNSIQAIGSTVSYAKRYIVGMLLNIITKDQDDDGNAAGWLTPEQLKNVEETILACEFTPAQHAAFLKFAEANSVREIRALAYDRVMQALRVKEKQHREGVR